MAGSNQLIAVNGVETWAYVVERDGGLRVQFSIDDWERSGLSRGQRVPVQLQGKADRCLYLAEVVELPPTVWVDMAQRVRAGGSFSRTATTPFPSVASPVAAVRPPSG